MKYYRSLTWAAVLSAALALPALAQTAPANADPAQTGAAAQPGAASPGATEATGAASPMPDAGMKKAPRAVRHHRHRPARKTRLKST